jgi:hypothetical protein
MSRRAAPLVPRRSVHGLTRCVVAATARGRRPFTASQPFAALIDCLHRVLPLWAPLPQHFACCKASSAMPHLQAALPCATPAASPPRRHAGVSPQPPLGSRLLLPRHSRRLAPQTAACAAASLRAHGRSHTRSHTPLHSMATSARGAGALLCACSAASAAEHRAAHLLAALGLGAALLLLAARGPQAEEDEHARAASAARLALAFAREGSTFRTCAACLARPNCCVHPCGHVATCGSCALSVYACPFCGCAGRAVPFAVDPEAWSPTSSL